MGEGFRKTTGSGARTRPDGARPRAGRSPDTGRNATMPTWDTDDRQIPLRDRRILIVEDEAIVAMMFEDELLEAGARVIGPAATAAEALRLVEVAATEGGLDAAVLDLNLQGEMALLVADRLAARGVPFLFATGYAKGCDTGGHSGTPVLYKPFNPHQLVGAVASLATARTGGPPTHGGCQVSP